MKRIILALSIIIALAGTKVSAQGCGGDAPDEGMKIFGFLQSQYEYHMTDPSNNSFSFERARIGAMGKIPYDFSYYVVLEMSPFISANPYLLDAFITYDRFEWARLSVGSFKTPFGLEVNTACNNLTTVYRSTATLQMVAPFRDMGMVLMGGNDNTAISYQLGLMNGSGLLRADNNTKKDIVGRLTYKPFEFIRIGASFRYGYPSLNNTTDNRTSFGAELTAKYEGFKLEAEFINDEGNYNRDLGGGCSGNLIELGNERSGGYATLSYLTKWNVEPVFRFDFFDSGNTQAYKESNMTFGINYFLNDWTRLQANYIYRSEDGNVPLETKNDEFVIQLQVKF
jgi:phosphate-selective porin